MIHPHAPSELVCYDELVGKIEPPKKCSCGQILHNFGPCPNCGKRRFE